MDEMMNNAAVITPITKDQIYWYWLCIPTSAKAIKALCESHERLRMELEAAMKVAKEINDMMAQVTSMGSVS